jgi:hypothetical protein
LNEKVDALVISTSTLQPCEDLMENGKLEIIFRSSILENFVNWKCFDDYVYIKIFMKNLEKFSENEID